MKTLLAIQPKTSATGLPAQKISLSFHQFLNINFSTG